MKYDYILAFDPSGNFEEGKGTTGCCLFSAKKKGILNTWNIKASDYKSKEEYWQAHLTAIKNNFLYFKNLILVVEDFTLNPRKAMQQSHSRMETPKLIGVIQMACAKNKWPIAMQLPVEAKSRWPDNILEHKHLIQKQKRGYIVPENGHVISRHEKDAIRHAVHFNTFYNKGD